MVEESASLQAFFEPSSRGGQRLYLHHTPAHAALRGALLYVHPWAEEMNKSRRMAAMTARSLAAAGWAVLQVDLLGCGDSSGDFGDAGWDDWVDDVVRAAGWLRTRHGDAPLWLWGLRSGALLCAAAARRLPDIAFNHLYWQPVLQGKLQLQQFLRLKAAAQWADGASPAEVLKEARARLAGGLPVEVAGYRLTPAMAKGLEAATLEPVGLAAARLVWLELQSTPQPALSPAAQARLPDWKASGWALHTAALQGPAFWQTTETEDAPALVAATVSSLQDAVQGQRDRVGDGVREAAA